jgi:hypothetical protein
MKSFIAAFLLFLPCVVTGATLVTPVTTYMKYVLISISPLDARNKLEVSVSATLVQLVASGGYQLTVINRDSNFVVTNATVLWPDGTYGVFTTTSNSPTWLAIDAFTITYTNASKTVTQASVTRDSSGNVTAKPALTVTP